MAKGKRLNTSDGLPEASNQVVELVTRPRVDFTSSPIFGLHVLSLEIWEIGTN